MRAMVSSVDVVERAPSCGVGVGNHVVKQDDVDVVHVWWNGYVIDSIDVVGWVTGDELCVLADAWYLERHAAC